MAFDNPVAITGLSLSALNWRRAQSGSLAHSDDALSAMPGVLAGFACTVATLTLTVGVGSAVVTPSAGANGSYLVINGTTGTATFTAQDATYARIDRVVLRVYDTEADASGQSKAAVEIITGTPSASPVAPTLPSGRLEIYQAQVPKSGSGSITLVDRRVWTATVGPIVVPSSADLPTGSWLRPGMRAVVGSRTSGSDTLWEYEWDGYQWVVQTSPWQAITFGSSGWSAVAGRGTPGVRILGGVIRMRGVITGALTSGANYIAVLPDGFYPTLDDGRASCVQVDSNSPTRILACGVSTVGLVQAWSPSAGSGCLINLGAWSTYSVI